MQLRNFVVPVNFNHFNVQLWIDLLGEDGSHQWPSASLSKKWHEAATESDADAVAIFKVHAGNDPDLYDTPDADSVYTPGASSNLLGPACSSATNVAPPLAFYGLTGPAKGKESSFNPLFGANCNQPLYPSPQPGSLTYLLTNGARTYATSGPFIYMTKYRPPDFFDRASSADPTLPWVPGTHLDDIALGGLPFRNLFPMHNGGEFGYKNKEIIEWSLPCFDGRSPNNKLKPCSPYKYSKGE